MALFTRENAAEFAKRSHAAHKEKKERIERVLSGQSPIFAPAEEMRTRQRVQQQIERCDEMLLKCKSPKVFVQLTAAKERLWNLIYPKPGSLKPKSRREERAPISPLMPLPIEPATPLVAPIIEPNHNGEISG